MLTKFLAAATAATLCTLTSTVSVAAPITITQYGTRGDINAALDSYRLGTHVVEDFEQFGSAGANSGVAFESGSVTREASPGVIFGELTAAGIATSVGNISTYGSFIGSGGTCRALDLNGDGCSNIALQHKQDLHGQGNIAPLGGSWSLNAADTGGFIWKASSSLINDIGKMIFALRDPADAGATVSVSTEIGGVVYSESLSRLGNENLQLIEIDFGATNVSSAEITIASSRRNDSMTIDGLMLVNKLTSNNNDTPAPVPLPAPALLLLGGFGALGVMRKLRKAPAA